MLDLVVVVQYLRRIFTIPGQFSIKEVPVSCPPGLLPRITTVLVLVRAPYKAALKQAGPEPITKKEPSYQCHIHQKA